MCVDGLPIYMSMPEKDIQSPEKKEVTNTC